MPRVKRIRLCADRKCVKGKEERAVPRDTGREEMIVNLPDTVIPSVVTKLAYSLHLFIRYVLCHRFLSSWGKRFTGGSRLILSFAQSDRISQRPRSLAVFPGKFIPRVIELPSSALPSNDAHCRPTFSRRGEQFVNDL